MINRTIIRTRALQVAYAFQHRELVPIKSVVEALELSLRETYELYLHLLGLLPDLSELQGELLEARKRRHLATDEDRNPNMRFAANSLAAKLRNCKQLEDYASSATINWRSNDSFLRRLLDKILSTEAYTRYLESKDSEEADTDFWVEVYRDIIFNDNEIAEELESHSLFWDNPLHIIEKYECEELPSIENLEEEISLIAQEGRRRTIRAEFSPIEIAKDFVLKTLRKLKTSASADEILAPMYRDEADHRFAIDLISTTMENQGAYKQKLQGHLINWDGERVADMDMLIMQMAIAEIYEMDDIPMHISINEYVELSKNFSSPKSYSFINGVLDNLAQNRPSKKQPVETTQKNSEE